MGLIGTIISLIITGLIIGALARLIIPGPNPMSILATIGLGVLGALIGGFIAGILDFGGILTIILEIAAAVVLVYFFTRRGGGRRARA